MNVLGAAHSAMVHRRRVRVLAEHLGSLIPKHAAVLDVGCGDGLLAAAIRDRRPDVRVTGIDVMVRPNAAIPVTYFDGLRIPYGDAAFDVVMLVDVMHHADSPGMLLADAARVAGRYVLLKDHVVHGRWSHMVLRVMDVVGNRHLNVALPYTYWSSAQWEACIDRLPVRRDVWQVGGLRLYPRPADWLFGRKLHLLARLTVTAHQDSTASRADDAWERAYVAFETRDQEFRKFTRRLRRLGAMGWARDAAIVELFSGRGTGIMALQAMGFFRLTGIDLSLRLLRLSGHVRSVAADCRAIPVRSASQDVAIVQGGLHHLPILDRDLPAVVAEVQRILKPGGLFAVVEPWQTPFLHVIHWITARRILRTIWPRVDALGTMIDLEGDTYRTWLAQPDLIARTLTGAFDPLISRVAWGKFMFLGRRRSAPAEAGERHD